MFEKKERKVRSDKKVRVNLSLDQDTHKKLERLAIACGLPKTNLGNEIVRIALNNPSMITFLQDKFHADEFRIIPTVLDGKTVTYVSAK